MSDVRYGQPNAGYRYVTADELVTVRRLNVKSCCRRTFVDHQHPALAAHDDVIPTRTLLNKSSAMLGWPTVA